MDADVLQMLQTGQEDLLWFNANLQHLRPKYNNTFIAFHEKKILETDADLNALLTKLHKKNVDPSSVFIEFVSDVRSIL